MLETAAKLCLALGTDGLRGELTLVRSARALAALNNDSTATLEHLKAIAPSVLRHRLRRDPLDESSADIRVERVIAELFNDCDDLHTVSVGGCRMGRRAAQPLGRSYWRRAFARLTRAG